MINCPHCGAAVFGEPSELDKLSPQQLAIYRILESDTKHPWPYFRLAAKLYEDDASGGAEDTKSLICTQIFHMRKRLGNVIETTKAGYRLRVSQLPAITAEETTESGK